MFVVDNRSTGQWRPPPSSRAVMKPQRKLNAMRDVGGVAEGVHEQHDDEGWMRFRRPVDSGRSRQS